MVVFDARQSCGKLPSALQKKKRVRMFIPRRSSYHIIQIPILVLIQSLILSNNFIAIHAKKSIPHSWGSSRYIIDNENDNAGNEVTFPPWNPSPKIDENGFLTECYSRIPGEWEREVNIGGKYGPKSWNARSFEKIPVTVRQVPGDGNCLFHSITVALSVVEERRHFDLVGGRRNGAGMTLWERSALLRQEAVNILSSSSRGDTKRQQRQKKLFLQGSEYISADELLNVAASQYQITGEEYCNFMRKDGYWGGGPEIVALCNALKRPIHVYELTDVNPPNKQDEISVNINDSNTQEEGGSGIILHTIRSRRRKLNEESSPQKPEFRLRRMACFGSPRFDNKEPLHILSADCRFPDLRPGRQASNGNHFLALFPADSVRNAFAASPSTTRRLGFRVRSGGGKIRVKQQAKNEGNNRKKDMNNLSHSRKTRRRLPCLSRDNRKSSVKDTNGVKNNQIYSFYDQLCKRLSEACACWSNAR